ILSCCDDDDYYNSAITPILSTEELDNSLSMGDEHLDTILAMKSNEVIKSSVEDLVLIPSESEGIPDTMCDVHLVNNPTPLEAKDHFEIVINSNDDYSSKVAEIVISEDEEIEDDNLCEKLLNFPLTDMSDFTHKEFADELAYIISPPEYDCFYFRNLPDPGGGRCHNKYSTSCRRRGRCGGRDKCEESSHCQKKREATAVKIALLLKSRRN
nr:hypothetical protein [Tanacetum cinerariifolium]